MATELGNVEIAHLLVEHGMDVTAAANDGWTPLYVATELGNVDLMRVLVEHRTEATPPARSTRDKCRLVYYASALPVILGLLAEIYLYSRQT